MDYAIMGSDMDYQVQDKLMPYASKMLKGEDTLDMAYVDDCSVPKVMMHVRLLALCLYAAESRTKHTCTDRLLSLATRLVSPEDDSLAACRNDIQTRLTLYGVVMLTTDFKDTLIEQRQTYFIVRTNDQQYDEDMYYYDFTNHLSLLLREVDTVLCESSLGVSDRLRLGTVLFAGVLRFCNLMQSQKESQLDRVIGSGKMEFLEGAVETLLKRQNSLSVTFQVDLDINTHL